MKTTQILILALLVSLTGCSTDDDENDTSTSISNNPSMSSTINSVATTNIPDEKFEEYLISINVDDVLDGSESIRGYRNCSR